MNCVGAARHDMKFLRRSRPPDTAYFFFSRSAGRRRASRNNDPIHEQCTHACYAEFVFYLFISVLLREGSMDGKRVLDTPSLPTFITIVLVC